MEEGKKRVREEPNRLHNAMVKHIREDHFDQQSLAEFLDEEKPAQKPPEGAGSYNEFCKALYKVCYYAYKMKEEGDENWGRVDGLMRDAAVAVVEFKAPN